MSTPKMDEFWADVLNIGKVARVAREWRDENEKTIDNHSGGTSGATFSHMGNFQCVCNTNTRIQNIGRNGFLAPLMPLMPLTPLASPDCPDGYARLEREAIQAESSFGGSESDDITGFGDVVPVTMAQRRAINARLHGWVYPQEKKA